jgi:nicotinic acid mononucleotide adenylyltransferase
VGRVGIYPGSFNPPTVAHLAIAEAARAAHDLERLVLSVSRSALAKEHIEHPPFDDRIEVLRASVADLDWVEVRVTHRQLLVDIAEGFDVLVLGADKWRQIHDPVWYGGDPATRDNALARLPPIAVVPRDGIDVPADLALHVADGATDGISSTRARSGEPHLMTPAARAYVRRTGAWH